MTTHVLLRRLWACPLTLKENLLSSAVNVCKQLATKNSIRDAEDCYFTLEPTVISPPEGIVENSRKILNSCGLTRKELTLDVAKFRDFYFGRGLSYEKDKNMERKSSSLKGNNVTKKQKLPQISMNFAEIEYGPRESIAYLAARGPFTYAATYRVLREIRTKYPEWTPESILDFGSGVGMTPWAVQDVWSEIALFSEDGNARNNNHKQIHCIEKSPHMVGLAKSLMVDSVQGKALEDVVEFKQILGRPPIQNDDKAPQGYDLVVSAFALSEQPSAVLRETVLKTLWGHTKDFLVIIETGNHMGFSHILDARNLLVGSEHPSSPSSSSSSAVVVAPCMGSGRCPRENSIKPCHFPLRAIHRQGLGFTAQESREGIHSEKLSYLIVAKPGALFKYSSDSTDQLKGLRVVGHPIKKQRQVLLDVCGEISQDLETDITREQPSEASSTVDLEISRRIVPKSARFAWRLAKKSKWGDVYPSEGKNYVQATSREYRDK